MNIIIIPTYNRTFIVVNIPSTKCGQVLCGICLARKKKCSTTNAWFILAKALINFQVPRHVSNNYPKWQFSNDSIKHRVTEKSIFRLKNRKI